MGKVKKMLSLAFASLFRRNKGQNTVKKKAPALTPDK